MQKCRLNEKIVYAFKVINENEIIDIEYEKKLRKASEQGELKCEDCGVDVVFKFGKVKIPHFAHKNNSLGGGCSYSRETEEHIMGKKILMELMINSYKDIYAEIRYRFANGRWADLYFRFSDGQELAIEFQRKLNSVVYWEDKNNFYQENQINNLWIAAGKREEFENILREYEFVFQHRLFINDNNKLLILDVERKELIIASKMIAIDEETNEIIMDKIFFRTYAINSINIMPDGTIDCDYNREFDKARNEFIQSYLNEKKRKFEELEHIKRQTEEEEKRINEKLERKPKEEIQRSEQQLKETSNENQEHDRSDAWGEIGYSKNVYNNKHYKKKSYNEFSRNDDYYRDKVRKAILGYRYGIENLVRILLRGGATEYNLIKNIFEEEIGKGNLKAKKTFDEVLKQARLD